MVFSSNEFIFVFLPLVLAIYFLLRKNYRNFFLLAASLVFYAWGEGRYVLVMIMYMGINYLFGRLIEKRFNFSGLTGKRSMLITALFFNLGFLLFFKYFNFIVDNLNVILSVFSIHFNAPKIHLPIGISFYTFQGISYLIDVYRGEIKSQKSFINFSMYKALFSQLIAGPIVRYADIEKQIRERIINTDKFYDGVKRFIAGLGKKVIIANSLAAVADQIFDAAPGTLTSSVAWLGVICYSFQIFFDFSAYSDMAIGLGKMFGFEFLENFNYPYISQSVKDFWRRWHISLSTFFRDYVYIPLGGNRCSKGRIYTNLLIVFFLTGFWHGASWNFIIWGLWHGIFLLFERTKAGKFIDRMFRPLRHVYLLLVVLTGWVLFRADNLTDAVLYLENMFAVKQGNPDEFFIAYYMNIEVIAALVLGVIFSMPAAPFLKSRIHSALSGLISRASVHAYSFTAELLSAISLSAVFFYSLMCIAGGAYNPFIYFRF